MKFLNLSLCAAAVVALCLVSSAPAETVVTVKGSHLCCGACYKAVDKAVEDIDGASVTTDKKEKTIIVKADDGKTIEKTLAALAAAGFHGKTDNDKFGFKDNSGVKKGKVSRLALTGVHNCCGACNKAIKGAIASVDGVEADTAKTRSRDVVVEGEFDGLAVVEALNKAGFHVTLKKAK